jgi:hypothetical protein
MIASTERPMSSLSLIRFRYLLGLSTCLVGLTVAWGCVPRQAPEPSPALAAAPAPVLPTDEAQVCAECHTRQVAEWRASRHAMSTTTHNGLYRLMRAKALTHLGEAANLQCSRCHYADPPIVSGAEPAADLEPVTCRVCHDVPGDHADIADAQPRPLAGRATLTQKDTESLCASCHSQLNNSENQAICTTGPEAQRANLGSCVSCHMPRQGGHRFPGAYDRSFVAQAASLSLVANRDENGAPEVVVVVASGKIGHSLPTGTPLRRVVLIVRMHDVNGNQVWQNISGDPLADDPAAVMQRIFSDAQGNRPVPPFMGHGAPTDNRLEAGETRLFRYPIVDNAAQVEAELVLLLASPELLQAAGTSPETARPRRIVRSVLRLP